MRSSRFAELYRPNGCVGYRASPPAREHAPGRQTRIPLARGAATVMPPATAQHPCVNSPGRETAHAMVARSKRLRDIFVRIPRLLLALHRPEARLEFSRLGCLPLRV